MRYKLIKNPILFTPLGKPMTPHLLRYQGLAVDDYGFALDASNLGHPRWRRASLDFRSIRVIQKCKKENGQWNSSSPIHADLLF